MYVETLCILEKDPALSVTMQLCGRFCWLSFRCANNIGTFRAIGYEKRANASLMQQFKRDSNYVGLNIGGIVSIKAASIQPSIKKAEKYVDIPTFFEEI